mmetsp:Transcript_57627/g.95271  ORF Transcript_57627/g.95271 Transcript_57627/m.95271 type:complete len:100 (-) Transcript_57627:629-928(-)
MRTWNYFLPSHICQNTDAPEGDGVWFPLHQAVRVLQHHMGSEASKIDQTGGSWVPTRTGQTHKRDWVVADAQRLYFQAYQPLVELQRRLRHIGLGNFEW